MSQPTTTSCAQCLEYEARLSEFEADTDKLISALQARIDDLEERLGLNSTNSSKPPSTDQPNADRQQRSRNRDKLRRKGRGGKQRQLLPPERVTQFEPCKPETCSCCGDLLEGDDPDPLRHQTVEFPPVEPQVTEYQIHTLHCDGCGTNTRGQLPNEAKRIFGPRLVALISLMIGGYRLSRRQTHGFLSSVLNIELSLGSVHNQTLEAAKAVEEPVEQVAQAIREAPVVHCDETGWKRQKGYRVLWAATTAALAYFRIQTARSKAAAQVMLGAVSDDRIVISDRYSAYQWIEDGNRQVCWAHLDRDFMLMSQSKEPLAHKTGQVLLSCADDVFKAVAKEREGALDWAVFVEAMSKIRKRVEKIAPGGLESGHQKTRGVCKFIVEHGEALWAFARVRGVEVTNNRAERAIRPAVLWRGTSLGTRTDEGEKFVGAMLTLNETLRLQGRDVLSWLTDAIVAHRQGSPPPSLLIQNT